MPFHIFGRCNVRRMWRLNGEGGEERLTGVLVFQVLYQQVGKVVGFVTGKFIKLDGGARRFVAVDPAIVFVVVIFVADPGLEVSSPLRRYVLKTRPGIGLAVGGTIHVPFAKVGGMIA